MTNTESAHQEDTSVKALDTDKANHGESSEDKPNATENGHAESESPKETPVIKNTNDEIASETPSDIISNEPNQVVSIAEKKEEEVITKVILHQYPPAKHIPSLSPFCLKLETFLRLNKVPYESQYSYKVGKKGKMPWIEYKGERKADSSFIIEYLTEKFQLDVDAGLSDDEKALGRIAKVALEENTVYALNYHRYLDNFNDYKKLITPPSAGIGFNVTLKMTQRKMKNVLDIQGIGRHSKEEVNHIAEEDIKAVSKLLGEKPFLLGEKMTSYDCSLFGLFANILWGGLETALSTFIKEKAQNLVHYCERVKELCWPDWSEMVLGEKSEPALKKGFSFRKKKIAKPVKVKESEAAEQTVEKTTESLEPKDDSPESKDEVTEAKDEVTEAKDELPEVEDRSKVIINIKTEIKDSVEEDKISANENKNEKDQDIDKITEQPTQNGGTDVALIKSEE